jgi:CubicO group peptidase (beta-lactamase class C family)
MLSRYLKISGLALLFLLSLTSKGHAQADLKPYEAQWEGKLINRRCFDVKVQIRRLTASDYSLQLTSATNAISKAFKIKSGNYLTVKIDSDITFKGTLENGRISGFIQSGQSNYHIILSALAKNAYAGKWNILLAEVPEPEFFLSVENASGNKYEAYAFAGDPRFSYFSGFRCGEFIRKGNVLLFKDFRTGLRFAGKLLGSTIGLKANIAGLPLTTIVLHKSAKPWNFDSKAPKLPLNSSVPADMKDGIAVSSLRSAGFNESYLKVMVDSINANKVTNINSVLISRNGNLVYEQYFGGWDRDAVHDLRSASKSMSSAIIGIAMDKGILRDTSQKLYKFLPQQYQQAMSSDPRKHAISMGSLLTMSSGLDAIDFGIDRKSVGSEDEYQQTSDWVKTVVEAPMINYPGTHANYSSANPYLLGAMLASRLKEPMELFIDHNLFEPLGITNYTMQSDDKGRPYFGGGFFLRPRDMRKFGLLYANGGKWLGKQLISKNWVDASFKNYLILENHPEKNGYGFLWWHYTYKVNGKTINSIEARGAGGQYIFIIPQYQLVVVITSTNFRNHRVWQPEKVVENYILPAIMNK